MVAFSDKLEHQRSTELDHMQPHKHSKYLKSHTRRYKWGSPVHGAFVHFSQQNLKNKRIEEGSKSKNVEVSSFANQ